MFVKNKNITIIGLGLIGGSFAKALRKLGPKSINAVDINEENIKIAKEQKIIDDGDITANKFIKESDLIFICLYPNETADFVKQNMHLFKSGAIITDACGLKEFLVSEIDKVLRDDVEFIYGHPMAGKEKGGLINSDANIFIDRNYIICPTDKNKNIDKFENMLREIGFLNIVKLTAKEHDEAITFTSHLPHIMALSLMKTGCKLTNLKYLIGGSFKDATRVASINPNLWGQLFFNNRENLIDALTDLQNSIEEIKSAIDEKDDNKIRDIFEIGSKGRKGIEQ